MELPLSQGKVALIDDEDADLVGQYKWFAVWIRDRWYAMSKEHTNRRVRTIYLHRVIMGDPPGQRVDHHNGDTFDCRRQNLRICTVSQNAQNAMIGLRNKSGYKGVSWNTKAERWVAWIRANGRNIYLGQFVDARDASLAYDRAAREHFGEYARVNHAREGEQSAR